MKKKHNIMVEQVTSATCNHAQIYRDHYRSQLKGNISLIIFAAQNNKWVIFHFSI